MIPLILAAAIACLTPQGERLHLVRAVYIEEREAYQLPSAAQWCWLAAEGDTLRWPTGQAVHLTMNDGRVVRARRLLVNWANSFDTQELGIREVRVKASDLSGAMIRKVGARGTYVAAGFDVAFPMDSVATVQVGTAALTEAP